MKNKVYTARGYSFLVAKKNQKTIGGFKTVLIHEADISTLPAPSSLRPKSWQGVLHHETVEAPKPRRPFAVFQLGILKEKDQAEFSPLLRGRGYTVAQEPGGKGFLRYVRVRTSVEMTKGEGVGGIGIPGKGISPLRPSTDSGRNDKKKGAMTKKRARGASP